MLKVTLVKGYIGCTPVQRATLKALGLKRIHMVKEHPDNEAIRGMIRRVEHLVEVETHAS